MIKLLCDTNQMAFGSSSALLSVLNNINSVNTAFSFGITKEILDNSELIHNTINLDNKNSSIIQNSLDLSLFDAVLVVSNLTNINLYLDANIPVYYIDIHSWWHFNKHSRISKESKIYFYERFLVKKTEDISKKNNHIQVGPIINIASKRKKKKKIIVNVGGGENKWITPGVNSNYINLIFDAILQIIPSLKDYEVFIAGGSKAISQIQMLSVQNNFVAKTFKHDEFLTHLSEAEYLLTSPGLNAVFEGLYSECKVIFLPPQNASQIIQLKYYEDFGLVKKGLNLLKINDFNSIKKLDESELTRIVLNKLKTLGFEYKKKLHSHMSCQLKFVNTIDYNNIYNLAKKTLGEIGSNIIADKISSDINKYANTTVIIPTTGNRINLIQKAIKSVLFNTVQPRCIFIIIDNNDEKYNLIKEIYCNNKTIKVFHNMKMTGVASTRNYAMNHVKTEFLSFLDDDDEWDIKYLEEVFNTTSFDLALAGFKKKKKNVIRDEKLPPVSLKTQFFYSKNPGIRGSNITIKLSSFKQVNGFDKNLLSFNDMDFGIRISKLNYIKYKSIQKHLVIFNSHDEKRISTPGSKENIQGIRGFYDKYKNEMSIKDRALFKKRAFEIWSFKF